MKGKNFGNVVLLAMGIQNQKFERYQIFGLKCIFERGIVGMLISEGLFSYSIEP